MTLLVPSPHWTLTLEDERIVVRAGADAIYSVEDVDAAAARWIAERWTAGLIDAPEAEGDARRAVEELLGAGVLQPQTPAPQGCPRVALAVCGRDDLGLATRIEAALGEHGIQAFRGRDDGAPLTVVVRTTATLNDLAAQAPSTAALLADVAYDHTVSLGPLAVPGATACIRCYAERLRARWGDAPPPPQPRVMRDAAFIAALIAGEADLALRGESLLVNRTVAYDRRSHRVVSDALHRTPGCSGCDPSVSPAAIRPAATAR